MMTYNQTLDYLFSRLPMFQRIGAAAYKANLNNTHKISELLKHPHTKFKCIHVAGTNGKGSSSHMLAAVLQQAGYKTGLYTSPHLIDFRERIKINGKIIPKKNVVAFVNKYKKEFESIEPSFFEWTVGLAFDYFASQKVDVAIIEVGLGGRLDSTNIINPIVALITNIGYDHMNLLGNTLEKIASEKAGIIKHKTPVIISEQQTNIYSVFNAKAKKMQAPLFYADKRYKITQSAHSKGYLHCEITDTLKKETNQYKLDLTGNYQLKNVIGVINTIDYLKEKGFLIELSDIKKGLKQVVKHTGLLGRWQIIQKKPYIIADTAHNKDGVVQVLENLKRYSYKNLHMVLGAVNDKDIDGILKLFPSNATYYFVKASVPRALESNVLKTMGKKVKLLGEAYPSVAEGYKAAKQAAKQDDLVFVGGSTFVVGDLLSIL